MRLPLFPLHVVLFPEATLPLHIFEPRYRELVGRSLEHDEAFGIVRVREGEEVGPLPEVFGMGTESVIIASRRHADGRYDIVVEGRRRFRIEALDRSRNLLVADVTYLDEPMGRDAEGLAETAAALFEGILESMELAGVAVVDETWHKLDPRSLAYRIAAVLPASDDVKQELLEMPTAADRLRREIPLLMSIRRVGTQVGAA